MAVTALTTARRAQALDELIALAAKHGGRCLGPVYVNADTPLQWECALGHRWQARPRNVRFGQWCPACVRLAAQPDVAALASRRGGWCLSEYVDRHTPLRWRCREGHEWETRPATIAQGAWCPTCAQQASLLGLAAMLALAASKNGQCISTSYLNNRSKLQWQCTKGHCWLAAPSSVRQGHWCPQCARDAARLGLAQMKQLARAHGGECLSTVYVDTKTPMQWRCAQGHIWQQLPGRVIAGSWCAVCSGYRLSLAQMQALARHRGGQCLSPVYVNCETKLTWSCAEGHVWQARPALVKRGSWCPVCAHALPQRSRADRRYGAKPHVPLLC
ncbi:hypothetical protein [Chitiniphilus shinanonensis]|uniref:hypothetical protein n=1 Tax=Chitiniphilus shinanonensis TaxID=553088 RepID=UPI00304EF174